jgi:hypothetical protein
VFTTASQGDSRIRLTAARLPLALLVTASCVAGCGPDNPGEPRSRAESLAAPNLGSVHVYCVERDDVRVTPCAVILEAEGRHPRAEMRRWWLRAATSLRAAGTFTYRGASWRFDFVDITEPTTHHHRALGWRCPGDDLVSAQETAVRMNRRNPGSPVGIHTLADARRAGCWFGAYRAPFDGDN